MTILVSGAGGFIGRPCCRVLRDAGLHPVAALRKGSVAPDGIETTPVAMGLGPDTDWNDALAGASTVVHLAARVHVMNDRSADPLAEFRAVNTAGTLRLAEQAGDRGVGHFVFMSTIKVCGETTSPGHAFGPGDLAPEDPYAESKAEAEAGLAALAQATGMAVTVLRPPLVYGPQVKGNLLSLLRSVSRGLPLPLGAVNNRRSLIGVDNLADAIRAAVESRPAPGSFRVYTVCDHEVIGTAELARRLGKVLERPARLLPVPVTLLRLGGLLTGRFAAIQRLTSSLEVNAEDIRRDLHWVPPLSLDQGLAAMARWWKTRAAP
jgi:nucleoside-diphosphate-sugar epimerase